MVSRIKIFGLIIILNISVLGIIIIYPFFAPSPENIAFPYSIEGGSILKYDPEGHYSIIWNQGFNLSLSSNSSNYFKPRIFTVFILNMQTQNLTIQGLITEDYYQILNKTSLKIQLYSNPTLDRRIILFNQINEDNLTFAVIGDTQGFTGFYEQLIANTSTKNYAFILHLGDITPFGEDSQLELFQNISKQSYIPIFSVPGNHDIKQGNSTNEYKKYFGKPNYHFFYGGILFIALDSSYLSFSETTLIYLENLLSTYPNCPKVIFSHVPLFDPRPDYDHSNLNVSQTNRFFDIMNSHNVKIVISGHIHWYNVTKKETVNFLISGGGGAVLHELDENGGFHHITKINISLDGNNINFDPIVLTKQLTTTDILILKDNRSVIIGLNDMLTEFNSINGMSSFQNQYFNWRGYGYYKGIKIGDLLSIIGGMREDELLEVEAWDTLKQNYSYSVIFPNQSWLTIQGEVILAYQYNETLYPEWSDGYRIVFLAPDEGYSNFDCEQTSPPDEGYHLWPSAGFRWVKFIKSLKILRR